VNINERVIWKRKLQGLGAGCREREVLPDYGDSFRIKGRSFMATESKHFNRAN
jgi:hypothetical protein